MQPHSITTPSFITAAEPWMPHDLASSRRGYLSTGRSWTFGANSTAPEAQARPGPPWPFEKETDLQPSSQAAGPDEAAMSGTSLSPSGFQTIATARGRAGARNS